MQNNGGWALLMKQVRKGGCKDGSAPYTNQWCNGPVCEPSGWALDAKQWGLSAIDEMGEKGWAQKDGGWAAVNKMGSKGGGARMGAPYTNQWCTGPVCEPNGWVLGAKQWGLGTVDETD